jgi:glycosyltransferase involved in cell wall biosynthesis
MDSSMDKQKTILITAPYFPPQGGGLERYALEIGTRLHANHDWRVAFITSGEPGMPSESMIAEGVKVYRLPYVFKVSNTPFSFRWYGQIRRIMREENPDVVNIHMPVPGIGDIAAMVVGKRPLIVTYHAGTMKKGSFPGDVAVWLYEKLALRWLLAKASRIVCSSDFVREKFLGSFLEKSVTITPGVDSEFFTSIEKKKAPVPTVLFVAGLGRAEQHKGLSQLLQSIRSIRGRIPKAQLVVVGEGDMRSEYEEQAERLGIGGSVRFTGRLEGRELLAEYQRASVFALPSTNESFSMVVLEAMASGLPVVARRVGGIPLLVEDDKTGFLVEMNDGLRFTEALRSLLTDERLAASFGEAGQRKAKADFSWALRAEAYNNLFSSLLPKQIL